MKKVNFNPNCKYDLEKVVSNTATETNDSVYNIEISVDHSYLVAGIVVKNCRCSWSRFIPSAMFVTKDGKVKMKAMDEKAWREFNEKKIKPIEEKLKEYGIIK